MFLQSLGRPEHAQMSRQNTGRPELAQTSLQRRWLSLPADQADRQSAVLTLIWKMDVDAMENDMDNWQCEKHGYHGADNEVRRNNLSREHHGADNKVRCANIEQKRSA